MTRYLQRSAGVRAAALVLLVALTGIAAVYEVERTSVPARSCPVLSGHPEFTLSVAASSETATLTPPLAEGVRYRIEVIGTFQFNADGLTSDGRDLLIDGERLDARPDQLHRYCVEMDGQGKPISLQIEDSYYKDNQGVLTVYILEL